MSEFDLEARWVPFSERDPEQEKVVLAREPGGEAFGSVYSTEPDDDERVYIQNGEFYLGMDDVIGLEWLEVREKGGNK